MTDEYRITKLWRPIVGLTFLGIIVHQIVFGYWIAVKFGVPPPPMIPDSIVSLMETSLIVLIGGRSVEKGVAVWRNGYHQNTSTTSSDVSGGNGSEGSK